MPEMATSELARSTASEMRFWMTPPPEFSATKIARTNDQPVGRADWIAFPAKNPARHPARIPAPIPHAKPAAAEPPPRPKPVVGYKTHQRRLPTTNPEPNAAPIAIRTL